MPLGVGTVVRLLSAAAFTEVELDRLCNAVLGVSLSGITDSIDVRGRNRAIVQYAHQYGYLSELVASILDSAGDRPAVQNLIVGDDMEQSPNSGNGNYNVLLLAAKMDRVLEELADIKSRLRAVESCNRTPINWSLVLVGVSVAVASIVFSLSMVVR